MNVKDKNTTDRWLYDFKTMTDEEVGILTRHHEATAPDVHCFSSISRDTTNHNEGNKE